MSLQPSQRWASQGPGFNRPVADAVYATVMKMDYDEAVMFTRLVADAVLDDDLTVHGEMISKALNAKVGARVELLRSQLARTAIAKSRSGQSADAELVVLHELSKNWATDLFDTWHRSQRARDQQRSLSSGQFIKENRQIYHDTNVPHSDAGEARLGIAPPPATWALRDSERAAYQQAYHQVAALVKPYQRLGAGKAWVHLTDQFGEQSRPVVIPDEGHKLKPDEFNASHGRRIVRASVSVIPPNDEQGAYFNVFNALNMPAAGAVAAGATRGGALDPERLYRYQEQVKPDATDDYTPSNSVFRRLTAGSRLIEHTLGSAAGPQTQMALKLAQHVGGLGPAANAVVGPTVDRAAMRYRGTETKPTTELRNALDNDRLAAARQSTLGAEGRREVKGAERDYTARVGTAKAHHDEQVAAARRAWEHAGRQYKSGAMTKPEYQAAARKAEGDINAARAKLAEKERAAESSKATALSAGNEKIEHGKDQKNELAVERAVQGFYAEQGGKRRWQPSDVIGYFKDQLPEANLNRLHLQAGTVPPSQGVIFDGEGKIASQAVGYGDDHYLPWPLAAMRQMRGGSYIRTRTWGGPTAEDIRTALFGGARRLTVVSNNGVFHIEFDQTFRGGRRHNDKAHRMIGRYEHLLDAVGSEKVSRAGIDPERLKIIEAQVATRINPRFNKSGYDRELERAKEEEKKNPQLSPAQLEEVSTAYIEDLAEAHGATGEQDLVRDIGMRLAKPVHDALVAQHKMEVKTAEAAKAQGISVAQMPAPPPSLEVVATQAMDPFRGKSQSELAVMLAGNFKDQTGLAEHLERARRQNADDVRELRLDGPGYKAAMDALREQFPYYIARTTFERWANQKQESDTGYVRPGRNRPGAAKAGLFNGPNGATKADADSVRGQSWEGPHLVPATARAAEQRATPEGTPATPEDTAAMHKRINRNMLDALLDIDVLPQGAKVYSGQKWVEIGGHRIGDLANEGDAPSVLKRFWASGVSRERLHEELNNRPEGVRQHMKDAVAWLKTNNAAPSDARLQSAMAEFETGGVAPTSTDETETGEILSLPNREYRWAHVSDAYVPGSGRSAADIAIAYRDDPLVAPLHLPPVDADDFDTKAAEVHGMLKNDQDALERWRSHGRPGIEPVNEDEHTQAVHGLVHAKTLRRRWVDADRAEKQRAAAEQARRQADFEREQDNTHQVQDVMATVASWQGWTPAQKERLVADPAFAEQYAEDMKNDPNLGGPQAAREFLARIEAEKHRRAQGGVPAAIAPFDQDNALRDLAAMHNLSPDMVNRLLRNAAAANAQTEAARTRTP